MVSISYISSKNGSEEPFVREIPGIPCYFDSSSYLHVQRAKNINLLDRNITPASKAAQVAPCHKASHFFLLH